MALTASACGRQPANQPRTGEPAQEPRRPAAPPAREVPGDIGSITGRVLADATGAPIRRVEVTASTEGSYARRTVTDANGRYELRELPLARFRLAFAKAGFVGVDLGQRGPFTIGREIEITDARTVAAPDVRLVRGAVVTGRIVDEIGEPIAGAVVEAVRWGYSRGQRVLQNVPSGSAPTDDHGRYRLYGLPAGVVYLRAASSAHGAATVEDDHGWLVFYVPAYYPGTLDVAEARPLELEAGRETDAKDFALKPTPGVRVSGIVIGSSGLPRASGEITLLQFADGAYDRPVRGADNARIGSGGAFTLPGVAPGRYLLHVQTAEVVERPDGRGGVFHETRGQEYALMPIDVTDANVDSLRIVTAKGGTARGRVVFEGGAMPRFGPNSVTITAPSVGFPVPRATPAGTRGGVRTDWTFQLTGLIGARVLRVAEPVGWTLKAVHLNGRDITDTPIEFTGNETLSGLEVVLGNSTTELTGSVTGTDGKPALTYAVVVFPDDPAKWKTLALPAQAWPVSRVVKVGRPDQRGQFRVTGLPAGRYLAVAVEVIDDGEWNVAETLARLRPLATPVTLVDGERTGLNLRLARFGG